MPFHAFKKHVKLSGVGNICQHSYGDWLGEYLWRASYLSNRAVGGPEWRDEAFWSLSEVLSGRYYDRMLIELGGTPCALDKMYADFFTGVELAYRPSSSTHVHAAPAKSDTGASSSGLQVDSDWPGVEPCFKAEPIPSAPRFAQSLANDVLIELSDSDAGEAEEKRRRI